MEAAIAEWLAWCHRNDADLTVYNYRRILTQFRLSCGSPPLDRVTHAHIERYIDILLESHNRNSVNTQLKVLKSFWSWEHRRHGVPNLAAGVHLLKPDPTKQRVITPEEYSCILAVCQDARERDIIQMYGNTGLRRGELLDLRPSDIAPDLRSLRVRVGKGRKTRTVPMNAICRDIVERNRSDNNHFLFLEREASSSGQGRLCRRLARRAAIPSFGPHALRHYFATRLILAGVALKVVSKILGHSSVAITEHIYCHIIPVDLYGATDMLTH